MSMTTRTGDKRLLGLCRFSVPLLLKPHLIELGGLVQKAGLVELADDDRATLYGALLELAAKAREDGNALSLWKRRGKRAFDAEADDG